MKLIKRLLLCVVFFLSCWKITEVVILNADGVWQTLLHYSSPKSNDRLRFDTMLHFAEKQPGKKILYIGSSQVREGVDAEYLNFENRNYTHYNLGVSLALTPLDLFSSKEAIIAARPVRIFYFVNPLSFYDANPPPLRSLEYYPSFGIIPSVFRYLGLKLLPGYGWLSFQGYVNQWSFFYRYRGDMEDLAGRYINEVVYKKRWQPTSVYGFQGNQPESYFIKKIRGSDGNEYKETIYTPFLYSLFVQSVRDFVKHNIQVTVINAPIHPRTSNLYHPEVYADYEAQMSGLAKSTKFQLILKKNMPEFSGEDFIDFYHLNNQGRSKLTKYISTVLSGPL